MPTKPSDTDRDKFDPLDHYTHTVYETHKTLTSNSSMRALGIVILIMGILFFGCIFGTVIYLVYFM